MCTVQIEAMGVEQLDDHALLDLAERALAVLGTRPLDGAVDDDTLAGRVERLHRLTGLRPSPTSRGRSGR